MIYTGKKEIVTDEFFIVSIYYIYTVVPRYLYASSVTMICTTETSTSDGISLGTDLFLSKFTML